MTERTLTAMYDSRGAAESARDGLVALGVPNSAITIRDTDTGTGTSAAPTDPALATEDRGFWGSLADAIFPDEDRYTYAEGIRRGGCLLTARVPEDMEDRASDVLERWDPIDVDERAESWRQSGWTGYQAGTTDTTTRDYTTSRDYTTGTTAGTTAGTGYGVADTGATARTSDYATTDRTVATDTDRLARGTTGTEETIPIVEEQVRVGKRDTGGGRVRVRSYVVERPVEEQVTLRDETVRVERRPADREVTAGEDAFRERTIEAVERDEEPVVSKTTRVVGEVGLRKDVEERTETVRDTVRKTEVEVDDGRTTTDRDVAADRIPPRR